MDPRDVTNSFLAARVTRCLKKLRNPFLQEPNFCFSKENFLLRQKNLCSRNIANIVEKREIQNRFCNDVPPLGTFRFSQENVQLPIVLFYFQKKRKKRKKIGILRWPCDRTSSSRRYCNAAIFSRCSDTWAVTKLVRNCSLGQIKRKRNSNQNCSILQLFFFTVVFRFSVGVSINFR